MGGGGGEPFPLRGPWIKVALFYVLKFESLFFLLVYEAFEIFTMLAAENKIVKITDIFSSCCLQVRRD